MIVLLTLLEGLDVNVMSVGDIQNLNELEEDSIKLGKQEDFSLIVESAREVGTMPEIQEVGGVRVRMDYEFDYISCVFEIIGNEDCSSCDLVYRGTYHHKY